jgi:hypothetical protein
MSNAISVECLVAGFATLALVDVGMNVLKLLAVAGGFMIGGLGSGLAFRGAAKLALARQVPRPLMLIVRLLGGVAAGLAVYVWAFGTGGSGFGSGSGLGSGGQGQPVSTLATTNPGADRQTDKANQPGSEVLRVVMLGGDRVSGQRFYLVEGDKDPKNLPDLQERIQARQEDKDKPPLKSIEIIIYEDSVSQEHPAVRDLKRWATQHDLTVTLSEPRGKLP